MNTISLADLAPILAAVLGPMVAFAVVVMRYQHLDSTKTRDLIDEARTETRDLINENRTVTRDLINENRDLINENRDLINKVRTETREGLRDMGQSLGDARERLARIEGHLGISQPNTDTGNQDQDPGEAGAA